MYSDTSSHKSSEFLYTPPKYRTFFNTFLFLLLFSKSIPSCTYTSFGIIVFLLPFSFCLNILFCCNATWSSSASTYNIFTSLFLSTFISGSTISILCILFITACLLISSIYVAFSPAFL